MCGPYRDYRAASNNHKPPPLVANFSNKERGKKEKRHCITYTRTPSKPTIILPCAPPTRLELNSKNPFSGGGDIRGGLYLNSFTFFLRLRNCAPAFNVYPCDEKRPFPGTKKLFPSSSLPDHITVLCRSWVVSSFRFRGEPLQIS